MKDLRFLTVTPICPNETAQADAAWDVNVMGNIIAQVAATYPVDTTRVCCFCLSAWSRADGLAIRYTSPHIAWEQELPGI